MPQIAIPFHFFRGGTSRGPFYIDGIGGGNAVTTKVAMLSASAEPDVDVDYLFAQVHVMDGSVDYKPTCGNMLVGVGPAAIEMGLVKAVNPVTRLTVRAVNTGAIIDVTLQTPDGKVEYSGSQSIDGVPGTAAPVSLDFRNITGAATGRMLPSGNVVDVINGIPVTCIDVTMPMVIASAESFGLSGYESQQELDDNQLFFDQMEAVRLKGAQLMGMGDCSKSVTPKFGLVSKPKAGGSLCVRYFMPWRAHPALAVTGSQCLSACALQEGSVAHDYVEGVSGSPVTLELEHAAGSMQVRVNYLKDANGLHIESAGVTRTARLLARGEVFLSA